VHEHRRVRIRLATLPGVVRALGAPIIGLAAVTSLPLLPLSASIGKIVAILALLPPWILIYLVSGTRGLRDGWPLADRVRRASRSSPS
jgi:L-lactate permease